MGKVARFIKNLNDYGAGYTTPERPPKRKPPLNENQFGSHRLLGPTLSDTYEDITGEPYKGRLLGPTIGDIQEAMQRKNKRNSDDRFRTTESN